ncbi:hypothetical protein B0J14DRAFT_649409 [Halenospora varia]|nr:hypothetical protein B0J14DRAFT_649409 [Halenospora varia]
MRSSSSRLQCYDGRPDCLESFFRFVFALCSSAQASILRPAHHYCPAQDSTSYWLQWDTAPPGYTCNNFTITRGIHPDRFVEWNPSVGTGCANWKTGYSYCIAVYHFKQPGIVSTCNQYTLAHDTDSVRSPCLIVETQYGLTHGRFVAWNPAVGVNCTGIERNYDYCVSIPGFKPVFSTTIPAARIAAATNSESVVTTISSFGSSITPGLVSGASTKCSSTGTAKATNTSKV